MILKVRPEAMLEVLGAETLVREGWEGVVQGVCQVSSQVNVYALFHFSCHDPDRQFHI